MEFHKFPDIENAYRTEQINKIVQQGYSQGEWEVQEKIHGSAFSINYDGVSIKVGKRNGWVGDTENFNGSTHVIARLEQKIKAIWHTILMSKNDMKELVLFGEIFGGSYNHPNVAKDIHATKCQKGIDYCPHNDFYGFDIMIDGVFQDTHFVEEMYQKHQFFYAKPLFRGSFEDCLKYPNEFDSKIPEWFGLPPISPNICEGVVLRPKVPRFFGCGSRVILKNKNDKWSEKSKESKHPKPPKEEINLSDAATVALDSFSCFVHENRLKNVLSKIGEVTNKDFGKIMGLFMKDIHDDFMKEHPEFDQLDDKEKKIIKSRVGELAQGMIRKNFVNILDRNF